MKIILGLLVGGGRGFACYQFIGCAAGTGPLTSNPYRSTIYGAVIGLLIVPQLR